MAEQFSYSVAVLLAGIVCTVVGLKRDFKTLQTVGIVGLGIAACKVFLWDAATLEGLWRAVSFIGLGGSLIALGWLFQKLQLKPVVK